MGLVVLVLWVIQQIVGSEQTGGAAKGRPQAAPQQPQPQGSRSPRVAVPPAGQQADPLRNQVEEFLRRAAAVQPATSRLRSSAASVPPAAAKSKCWSMKPRRATSDDACLSRSGRWNSLPRLRRDSRQPRRERATRRQPRLRPRRETRCRARGGKRHGALASARRADFAPGPADHRRRPAIRRPAQGQVRPHRGHAHRQRRCRSGAGGCGRGHESRAAAQIAAMLANPDGVRQAIVLNEILRRPSDRW